MLNDLKLLLGFSENDTDLDSKLMLIIKTATARLQLLLGGIEPPAEMGYIILEVAVARFNRIGSEGLASHSVEGESLQFTDDDFAPFSDEIKNWLAQQESTSLGKLRFI